MIYDAKPLIAFWRQLKQRPYVPIKPAVEMMEFPNRRFTMRVRRTSHYKALGAKGYSRTQ